jgi:hypothetical protein
MSVVGLLMLIVALLLMTSTGWPSYAILLGVSWVAAWRPARSTGPC